MLFLHHMKERAVKMFPDQFLLDQAKKTHPKWSILELLKIPNYYQKTSCKWSSLNY